MKQSFFLTFVIMALLNVGCDNFEDPGIPEINNYSLTLSNNEGVPLSEVWLKLFYTESEPGFVVDSSLTTVLGYGGFTSIEPRKYILKAFNSAGQELGAQEITVGKDNALNVLKWQIDVFVENYDFTVCLKDNRKNPIVDRKVGLYTSDDNPVLIAEGESDAEGKVIFPKTVVGTYNVFVYDEDNLLVFKQALSSVGSEENNFEEFVIRKIFHNTNIVITGFLQDPRGSDSPKPGAVSGDGFVHPGPYEYVQLMALKDIDFTEENYCVVFTNSGTPTQYGWAAGVYDSTSKKVYQMNLEKGSVKKGQFFYVGGSSRMICSYYQLMGSPQLDEDVFWGVDYYNESGANGNGAAKKGSGLLGNGSGKSQSTVTKGSPDGIAVFKGTNVNENTVPVDCVFYGTKVTYQAYQVPDNDIYNRANLETDEPQTYFGEGTNTFLFPVGVQDGGAFIKLGGQVTPEEWLVPRSGTPFVFNMKSLPGASVTDIENSTDCTVFIDK